VRAGELHVVDFGPAHVRGYEQAGTRPALVVHSADFLRIPNLALVCPLTTRARGVPNHVPIPADGQTGLRSDCFAMTEQVRAVDQRFVHGRIGSISPAALAAVLLLIRDRLLARPATEAGT
jgi:mRNA interferase MazF